jgi:hypothetical protein
MKRLFVIVALLFSVTVVSAQRHYSHGGYYSRPRVYVGLGVGAYNPIMPYYGYNPWYSYPPVYSARPARLSIKIEDIRADYRERIREARHDKSISRSERKQEIKRLKVERDHQIREAQLNYYRGSRY